MRKLIVIAHDIRSVHNLGSLLRTADAMGVTTVYCTGYTPYPRVSNDMRLPHQIEKTTAQIAKTALGAEQAVDVKIEQDIAALLKKLRKDYLLVALEQDAGSKPLQTFSDTQDVALLLGREVEGIDPTLLKLCDKIIEIPMFGSKESLNVTQAAAIALYHFRCIA